MKRNIVFLFVLMCALVANAQTYIYVHKDVNPASNSGNNQTVCVIIRDSNNDLWIYSVYKDLNQSEDASFLMVKNALMNDKDYFAHMFNRSRYAQPTGFNPHPDQNMRHVDNGLGAYKAFRLMKLMQTLEKCYVYREISTNIEYSIKKDFSVLVLYSNTATPVYYKRCTVSDFNLRRNNDDLF